MKTLLRFCSLFILFPLLSSCDDDDEKLIPDPPAIVFRGELGGVNMEMSPLAFLFPDESRESITLSFVRERSASTIDILRISIPGFQQDKSVYIVQNKEFYIEFFDSMALSGANKGEWHAVSGTLQITSYTGKSVKGKVVNAILQNADDHDRTLRLTSAEFTAEIP